MLQNNQLADSGRQCNVFSMKGAMGGFNLNLTFPQQWTTTEEVDVSRVGTSTDWTVLSFQAGLAKSVSTKQKRWYMSLGVKMIPM